MNKKEAGIGPFLKTGSKERDRNVEDVVREEEWLNSRVVLWMTSKSFVQGLKLRDEK